ncbi:hypothetical protein GE21DRAFT_2990 [Neurospora crassa]|uniref:Uncharacterized protein n=1 Tax=Neurospora crassa (strain ATCC 24698 / 74-OR23-1A / CBS 708.71 / DSM 1257 / FGSC 987) TaxID=367110 RepID=A7UWU2_NEUCR|nr:hypothetical protein NCU11108 [Neurospora crassa OR74A]EDO65089.2 hypothetical protein NCU11108 [Neurospora crassa OR74A]KHE85298.1 hypothetical protein GE21DRAFT_2990 [Neurospora crassa]|eukprot:XP_001728180.2 hypothetical protein NCU11108 [Neurospora crassa OR74A]
MALVVFIWPSVLDDRPLKLEDQMENPEYLEYLYYTQYWDAFIFWANRTWTLHEGPKFSLATLRNSIAAEGLLETGTRSKRTYCNDVGLPELRMLIDHDILHTGSREVAEVHHIAWALGRICALQSGSIGWSGMHDNGMFLNRKGVPISRGESLGDVREARTVERYYIDPIRTLDVSAIALGEEENQDRIATREAELALNVLRNDEASAPTPAELRNYKRRIRWAAVHSLFNEAPRRQVEDMNVDDEQKTN